MSSLATAWSQPSSDSRGFTFGYIHNSKIIGINPYDSYFGRYKISTIHSGEHFLVILYV
jgi:hypothetical protein